ncbi:MAG: hypothetical protein AB7E31_04330 [Desulfitobacterium sp.]
MQQTLWGSEHPADPRKDLVSDHRHWKDVLLNCWHEERDLYYLLHGFRCGGAELTLTKKSYRLMPGEWSESEWDGDIKDRLNHFKDKLVWIFKMTRLGVIVEHNDVEIRGIFG